MVFLLVVTSGCCSGISRGLIAATTDEMDGKCTVKEVVGIDPMVQLACRALLLGGFGVHGALNVSHGRGEDIGVMPGDTSGDTISGATGDGSGARLGDRGGVASGSTQLGEAEPVVEGGEVVVLDLWWLLWLPRNTTVALLVMAGSLLQWSIAGGNAGSEPMLGECSGICGTAKPPQSCWPALSARGVPLLSVRWKGSGCENLRGYSLCCRAASPCGTRRSLRGDGVKLVRVALLCRPVSVGDSEEAWLWWRLWWLHGACASSSGCCSACGAADMCRCAVVTKASTAAMFRVCAQ